MSTGSTNVNLKSETPFLVRHPFKRNLLKNFYFGQVGQKVPAVWQSTLWRGCAQSKVLVLCASFRGALGWRGERGQVVTEVQGTPATKGTKETGERHRPAEAGVTTSAGGGCEKGEPAHARTCYWQIALRPRHPCPSRTVSCSGDGSGESRTIALDALAARFMAVENAVSEGWSVSRHLEILTPEDETITPAELQLQARRHGDLLARAHGSEGKGRCVEEAEVRKEKRATKARREEKRRAEKDVARKVASTKIEMQKEARTRRRRSRVSAWEALQAVNSVLSRRLVTMPSTIGLTEPHMIWRRAALSIAAWT